MSEYKKLYNQIDKLNNKIRRLECIIGEKKPIKNTFESNSKSTLVSYGIYFPKESYSNKKYIGLKFDDNPNNWDCDWDEKLKNKDLTSFIKLIKSNVVINYNIQLDLNYTPIDSIMCSLAVGIRKASDSKIRIIKGTKFFFDIANYAKIDNKINITNTILYSAEDGEELCMIVDFDFISGTNCVINSKKSIIKLLFI